MVELDIVGLAVKHESWLNLFRVIRHKNTTLVADVSNFWATIQFLEQQLIEVEARERAKVIYKEAKAIYERAMEK